MSSSSSSVSARRRVCTSCQTSKRRCDQRLPRCTRCSQRNQECVYPSLSHSRESSAGPSAAPSSTISASQPPATTTMELTMPLSHFTSVLPGTPHTIGPVPVITSMPDPWPLFFNASGPANTAISRPAMDWGLRHVTGFPEQWTSQGLCPFINPALYGGASQLPPVLRDAFAVCAAYALKNDLNAPLVLGILEAKARALVYDPARPSWNPLEQLAALQALIMYQLLRWFDKDIRQRALADEDEAVLDSWTEALQARVGQRLFERGQEGNLLVVPPPLASRDTGEAPRQGRAADMGSLGFVFGDEVIGDGTEGESSEAMAEWRQFLFAESCRRTVIFAYTVRSIYAMAKQGYCRIGNRVMQMSFMASSVIWGADSASSWNRARNSESYHWVERMDFEPMLISARPGEVDSLSLLLAVSYKGPDVIEEWMIRRGSYAFPQALTEMGFGTAII